MPKLGNNKIVNGSSRRKDDRISNPEISSAIVRLSHKISRTNGQVVKIGDKYYRIKEIG